MTDTIAKLNAKMEAEKRNLARKYVPYLPHLQSELYCDPDTLSRFQITLMQHLLTERAAIEKRYELIKGEIRRQHCLKEDKSCLN